MCNVESCDFDRGDCFHDNTECYRRSDGADYRGTISKTMRGVRCQRWSDQAPQAHTVTHATYPRAGLGGHNYCRNPDGEQRPSNTTRARARARARTRTRTRIRSRTLTLTLTLSL